MVSTLLRAHSGGQGLRPEIKPCPKIHTTLPKSIADLAQTATLPAEWIGKQIHLEETGLALIPGVDEYEVISE